MDCPKCGSKIPQNAEFCTLCLQKIAYNKDGEPVAAGMKPEPDPEIEKKTKPHPAEPFSDEEIFRMLREDEPHRITRKKQNSFEQEIQLSMTASLSLAVLFLFSVAINNKLGITATIAIIELLFAQLAHGMALSKGRNAVMWWFGGFFGSVFAATALYFLPANAKQGYSRKCKICAEIIKEDAEKCRFCGTKTRD